MPVFNFNFFSNTLDQEDLDALEINPDMVVTKTRLKELFLEFLD